MELSYEDADLLHKAFSDKKLGFALAVGLWYPS